MPVATGTGAGVGVGDAGCVGGAIGFPLASTNTVGGGPLSTPSVNISAELGFAGLPLPLPSLRIPRVGIEFDYDYD